MKILVTVLLTSLFVFALATAWVDFVQPKLEQAAQDSSSKSALAADPAPGKKRRRGAAVVEDPELLPVPVEAASATPKDSLGLTPRKAEPDPESAAIIAEKLDEVKRQESTLVARQEALRMIYDDIREELSVVDQIRKRASEDLAEAERRIVESAQPSRPTRTVKGSAPVARTGTSASAGATSSVRADAIFIRHLVDEGKMETAVSVLKSMKGRDAAGVLTYLSSLDGKLANQLADRVQADSGETVRR